MRKYLIQYNHFTTEELRTSIRARSHKQPEALARTRSGRRKQRSRYIAQLRELDQHFTFPLINLPAELRSFVYEGLLTRVQEHEPLWPQILTSAKWVRDEALAVLYGQNQFHLSLATHRDNPRSLSLKLDLALAGRVRPVVRPGRSRVPREAAGRLGLCQYFETNTGLPCAMRHIRRLTIDLNFECSGSEGKWWRPQRLLTANSVLFALVNMLHQGEREMPKKGIIVVFHHNESKDNSNDFRLTAFDERKVLWPLALLTRSKDLVVTFRGLKTESESYFRKCTLTHGEIMTIFRRQKRASKDGWRLVVSLRQESMVAHMESMRGRLAGIEAVKIDGSGQDCTHDENLHWLRQEVDAFEVWSPMVKKLLEERKRNQTS